MLSPVTDHYLLLLSPNNVCEMFQNQTSFRCTFSALHFTTLHLATALSNIRFGCFLFFPDMNKLLSIIFILHGYRYFKSLFNLPESVTLSNLHVHYFDFFSFSSFVHILIFCAIVISMYPVDCNDFLFNITFLHFHATVLLGHLE